MIDGYMEVTPGAGSLTSKERFKDFQLHLEFASPAVPLGISQYRGNSGVTIGGREIQILDNYNNATYADGYVGADLQPVAAAGQSVAPAGRMADARHRVLGGALRR